MKSRWAARSTDKSRRQGRVGKDKCVVCLSRCASANSPSGKVRLCSVTEHADSRLEVVPTVTPIVSGRLRHFIEFRFAGRALRQVLLHLVGFDIGQTALHVIVGSCGNFGAGQSTEFVFRCTRYWTQQPPATCDDRNAANRTAGLQKLAAGFASSQMMCKLRHLLPGGGVPLVGRWRPFLIDE